MTTRFRLTSLVMFCVAFVSISPQSSLDHNSHLCFKLRQGELHRINFSALTFVTTKELLMVEGIGSEAYSYKISIEKVGNMSITVPESFTHWYSSYPLEHIGKSLSQEARDKFKSVHVFDMSKKETCGAPNQRSHLHMRQFALFEAHG